MQQIAPFVISGLPGMKDAAISRTTMSTSITVGNISSTFVLVSDLTLWRNPRNRIIMTGTVARAPSSTAKKIPSRPSIQKKDMKSIFA